MIQSRFVLQVFWKWYVLSHAARGLFFFFPRVWDVVFIHELLRMSSFYDLERDCHMCAPGPGPQRPKGQQRCSQQERQCEGAKLAFLVVADTQGFLVARW